MRNKWVNLGFVATFIIAAAALVLLCLQSLPTMNRGEGDRRTAAMRVNKLRMKESNVLGNLVRTQETMDNLAEAPVTKADPKMIKTADIRFQVRDLKKSRAAIERLVKASQGYIASDRQENSDTQIDNTLVIRIPSVKFDAFCHSLQGQALALDSKTVDVEDVTEQFVDVQARLRSKRELEGRYLAILEQAKSVKEVLEVEERLGKIREEIEVVEGRLKYLTDQVSYSTVTLDMYQTVRALVRPDQYFSRQFSEALASGWKGFLAAALIAAMLWPLVLVLGVVWLVAHFYRRRYPRVGPSNFDVGETRFK